MTIVNTILAGNTNGDCSGGVTSNGHNLDSDGTCALAGTGDQSAVNPLLAALALNAPGSTETHALPAESPAVDAGDDAACPAADQRGVTRPQDGDEDGTAVCDIGAFELQPPEPEPTPTPTAAPAQLPETGAAGAPGAGGTQALAVALVGIAAAILGGGILAVTRRRR